MIAKTSTTRLMIRGAGCLLVLLLPVAALAAVGGGEHADGGVILKDFLYRCFNFALMVGLLVYFVRKPIRNGLRNRREEIATMLADAEAAKEAAEAKYREYSEKLEKATEEIAGISAAIRKEGQLERDKILEHAREMSEKILQEADARATNAVARARDELRAEAARLAVDLAEEYLKKEFSPTDQKRLVEEYMQKVGELH